MLSRMHLAYILLNFLLKLLTTHKKANKIFSSDDDILATSVIFPLTQDADQEFLSWYSISNTTSLI